MSGIICPVCGKPVTNGCCFHCGYDETKDHLKHRSLAPVSGVSAMERRICLTRLKLRESAPRGKSGTAVRFAVGSYVTFGQYPQDKTGGRRPIEWLVLVRENDRILVISRYALDCQQYSTSNMSVTWETCSLRRWLNSTFMSSAFTSEEQAMIPRVTVRADRNPAYNTSPGNSTTDWVFLLSITEAQKCFSSDDARRCAPTSYATARGVYASNTYTVDGNGTCWWWLRSPGNRSCDAADVSNNGSVHTYGHGVNYGDYAVRPALWIKLTR